MFGMKATAIANSNIALLKYWDKKGSNLILPHNSSVLMTLEFRRVADHLSLLFSSSFFGGGIKNNNNNCFFSASICADSFC